MLVRARARARLPWEWRCRSAELLTPLLVKGVARLRRGIDIGQASPGVSAGTDGGRRRLRRRRLLGTGARPLRRRWPDLVCCRMNVCRLRRSRGLPSVGAAISQQLQPGLDVRVVWIQLGRTLVSIKGIANLIVAGFVLYRWSVL